MRAARDARLILEVEIDCGADPLAGVVRCDPHGSGEPFVGWMGLTRVIEMALERRRTEGAPSPAAPTRHTRAGRQP